MQRGPGRQFSPTRLMNPRLNGFTIAVPFSTRLKNEPHKFVSAIGTTGTVRPSRSAFSQNFHDAALEGLQRAVFGNAALRKYGEQVAVTQHFGCGFERGFVRGRVFAARGRWEWLWRA